MRCRFNCRTNGQPKESIRCVRCSKPACNEAIGKTAHQRLIQFNQIQRLDDSAQLVESVLPTALVLPPRVLRKLLVGTGTRIIEWVGTQADHEKGTHYSSTKRIVGRAALDAGIGQLTLYTLHALLSVALVNVTEEGSLRHISA